MKETRIAVRYAKALFDLALELKIIDQVADDMALVANTCKASRDFRFMLTSPIINTDKKQAVMKLVFENKIQKLSISFLNLITAKRRETHIEHIALQYIDQYRSFKGIETVYITTAVEADNAVREKAKTIVKNFTKKDIELVESIKKDIIGGFILKFGYYQYDDSIQSKIVKLKREYNINVYEKGF